MNTDPANVYQHAARPRGRPGRRPSGSRRPGGGARGGRLCPGPLGSGWSRLRRSDPGT